MYNNIDNINEFENGLKDKVNSFISYKFGLGKIVLEAAEYLQTGTSFIKRTLFCVVVSLMLGGIADSALADEYGEISLKNIHPEQKALIDSMENALAEKYRGDKGIENDPDVIFVENFEEGSLDSLKDRWDSVQNIESMSLSSDVPKGGAGERSLLIKHIGGKSTGAHLYRRLLPGYEKLHVRFYVKFDPACYPIHHFFHIGGYNPPTPWPQGGAGIRPVGNERCTTGIEPYGKNWRWDFYSYWMGMRSSPDKKSWGHDFINDPGLKTEPGEWICVELMMKMNDPVIESNGQQAVWIDGRPWSREGQIISHLGKGFPKGNWVWDSFNPDPDGLPFEGFQWRNTKDLKLNFLWVLLYITKAPEGLVSKVWFDNIVVAKKYIGQISPFTPISINTVGSKDYLK